MPTVTALEKQKRRPRFDVHLDGACAFSLATDLALERGLAVGMQIETPERREIEAEDQRRGAIASALRLLAMQPRSEQDLRIRLGRRGFPRAAVDGAIRRLRELGYLDDAAFARHYVEARQDATPRSRRALAFELGRKGVGRDLAAEAVAEVSDADAAFNAAQRRLRALTGLDRQAFTRRLGTFLAGRGFGYGVAYQVIDRCWRQLNDGDVLEDC